MRTRTLLFALGVFLTLQGTALAILQPLDLDGDGLSTARERDVGTDARKADTDGDGLGDGWEAARGIDPRSIDTDRDGFDDDGEVREGANPLAADTDGDGIGDAQENPAALPDADCDDDGVASVLESDDDADERPDGSETADDRCDRDVDGDGVLDGREGSGTCVRLPDCDLDGVADGEEGPAGFDPLDPDTFGVHLPDGVSYAFARAGQPAGRDADGDGIPDPWESQGGLIQWGPYAPHPDERDLLVEFVRVLGPGSGTYGALSYRPAYERVKDAFAANGITFQYVETVARLGAEPLPPLIPTRNAPYYLDVLNRSLYKGNPYVTTVVVNPQHDQTDVLHSGVAPIRGMLAAVDASQFVEVSFRSADGNVTLPPFEVFVESAIRDGRLTSPPGGIDAEGRFYIMLSDQQGAQHEFRWWPSWFQQPEIEIGASWVTLLRDGTTLKEAELAHTIFHEIGHTLGLCHTHDADCQELLPPSERPRQRESSMSYESDPGTVAFLPAEWDRVRAYLVCPPPTPVRLLAEGASTEAILDAKYAYTLEQIANVGLRACNDAAPVLHDLDPVTDVRVYERPSAFAEPARSTNSGVATATYWSTSVVSGVAAAGLVVRRLGTGRMPPPSGLGDDSWKNNDRL